MGLRTHVQEECPSCVGGEGPKGLRVTSEGISFKITSSRQDLKELSVLEISLHRNALTVIPERKE